MLTPGTRFGPYEVQVLIGQGGMGEVYRAHDARLKRNVALKVLPALFAQHLDRLARFEREAQLLASLNHPHVAAIYEIEESNGIRALVMELVEGPTLADRISQGAIPVNDALPMARQIAEALEAAHEAGIIHRDLKPANIKLRPDGTVKVLDFGLAKAIDASTSSGGLSNSATPTSPAMTYVGVILGTAPYMSPEQARGHAVDKRADIWAFGAVVFEMLTGAMAFPGDSVTDVLAAVVTSDPDWSRLPADVLPAVRRLIQRCLEKDHRQRLRDIGEARVALSLPFVDARDAIATSASPPRRRRELLAWFVAALSFFVAGAAIWDRTAARFGAADTRPVVFDLMLPEDVRLAPQSPPALSPDGRQVAFSAGSGGLLRIWLRSLDSRTPDPIPGTEGGQDPFWAPTGRAVGFFAQGKLKTVALDGSPPQVLCDVRDPRGGSWGRDGDVLFAMASGLLYRLPAGGGSPQPLRLADGARDEDARAYPYFLPDGRRFLYFIRRGPEAARGVYAASLDSDAATHLVRADGAAIYTEPGYLLFARESTLLAQRFDADRLQVNGEASPVATSIRVDTSQQNSYAATADTLVTIGGGTPAMRRLVWFNREGKQLGSFSEESSYTSLDLSSDGQRAVVEISDLPAPGDIWVVDLQRDTMQRVTSDPASDYHPAWAPDNERIVFSSNRHATANLFLASVGRVGQEEPLLTPSGPLIFPSDWSPDGRYIVYSGGGPEGGADLWMIAVNDRKPVPLLSSPFGELQGQVSPDGEWLAYVSNESGGNEVYVQTFPEPSPKTRISTRGGTHPRWRGDSKELFYISADGRLTSVTLRTGSRLEVATPTPLFGAMSPPAIRYPYDVTKDGQRFLISTVVKEGTPGAMHVTLGWTARLPP